MALSPELSRTFAEAARQAQELISQIPDRLNQWALHLHDPVDLGGEGHGPAWCQMCKKPWPCDKYVELEAVVASRSGE